MFSSRRPYLIAFVAALCLGSGAAFYWGVLADLPDPVQPLGRAGSPSILITDRRGAALYEVIDPQGNKFVPLPLSEIPPACQQATIATEDGRFYSHPGVDPIAIVRAEWLNLTGGHTVSGGSTLTQQLARNLFLAKAERNEQSLRRKLREAWLAWQIERRYSKNEILALYLNTTFYGHFAVGLEAAAQAYFGSHARDLDLAQCALLAGIPQYPYGYNPTENPDAASARQAVVLGLMVKAGYIDAEKAHEAGGERLALAPSPFPIEAPHFVMWVQSQLEILLPPERLRAGGLRVVTTLDLDWQHQAEATVARRLAQLQPCLGTAESSAAGACDPEASPLRRVDDAALVALDPGSGAVRAMVGSADYFNPGISGAVNAALSLRQPGSAIKPLTYAAAFDPERARTAGQEPWTAATLLADVRTVFPTAEGRPYVPQNYDLRYHGPVTARAALANSYNIPAVKTLQFVGVDTLIEEAESLGIKFIADFGLPSAGCADTPCVTADPQYSSAVTSRTQNPNSFGLALTLGGGEVRLLDLTAAYAAFANGGRRVTPYAVERVETLDGQVLCEQSVGVWECGSFSGGSGRVAEADADPSAATPMLPNTHTPTSVLDPRVAYLITNILSDNEARIPAFGRGSVLEIGRPAAAKTGTTTDWRDNWTVGYTPGVATGVWVGNADNAPMVDVSGVSGAGPMWHDFMLAVLRGTPVAEFARPDGLVQVEVCADSGLLPGSTPGSGRAESVASQASGTGDPLGEPQTVACPQRRMEWFIAGTEPRTVDASHVAVSIDVRSGGPVGLDTPPGAVSREIVWLLPPELQEWARDNGVPQAAGFAAAGAGGQDVRSANAPQSGARGSPTTSSGSAEPLLRLSSPDPNRTYRLDPLLPAGVQQLPVTARLAEPPGGRDTPITLWVDGRPIATVSAPDYTAWWPLVPGRHTVQATLTLSDGSQAQSAVTEIYVN